MTEYMITSPEGRKFKVTAPEGASQEDALAMVQKQHGGGGESERGGVADFFMSMPRGALSAWTGLGSAMGQSEANLMGMEGVPGAEETTQHVEKNVTGELPKPQGTAGKFGAAIGETLASPTSYLGPGGIPGKIATGITSAIGSEAAGQATEGTGLELPARILGGAAGAGVPRAAARTVTPLPLTAERAAMQGTLDQAGIETSAGQQAGRRSLKYAEGHLGELVGAGGATEAANARTAEQFNSWALRQVGETANRASPEVMDRVWTRLGGQFDALTARNQMHADVQWYDRLTAAHDEYRGLVPESQRAPAVENLIRDLGDAAVANNGVIDGRTYQAARSRLDRLARAARADPERAEALREMTRAMDDAMERTLVATNSPDVGAFRDVRNQYRNALVLQKAIGIGEDSENIKPNKLRQALIQQNEKDYKRGRGDFAEVTHAADTMLAPLPQSGTAPRMSVGQLTSVPLGVAGRGLMSRPAQGYLKNQVMTPYMDQIPGGAWPAARGALTAGAGDPLAQGTGP